MAAIIPCSTINAFARFEALNSTGSVMTWNSSPALIANAGRVFAARYPVSSVRQSLSIRCQNTGEGQRFRASHW